MKLLDYVVKSASITTNNRSAKYDTSSIDIMASKLTSSQ